MRYQISRIISNNKAFAPNGKLSKLLGYILGYGAKCKRKRKINIIFVIKSYIESELYGYNFEDFNIINKKT